MKKLTLLDQTKTPDGQVLALYERDGEYTIRLGGLDLMGTRQHTSEEVLAELGCAGIPPKARVLVGGLGFGFTLKAALTHSPPGATVVVSELLPKVVEWNRKYQIASPLMDHPRVEIVVKDVREVLQDGEYDAILLDVDNSPRAFTTKENARLYGPEGLALIHRALRPKGKVAVWSAEVDPAFEKALARAGFRVETHGARSFQKSGARHWIFLGVKDRPQSPPPSRDRRKGAGKR